MHILALVLCLVSTEFVMGSNSNAFQVNSKLKKKTCKNKDRSFKSFNVPSILTCGSSCVSHADCKSFFFFPSSSRCDGCSLTYGADSKPANSGEKTLYFTKAMFPYSGCFSTICGDRNCSYDHSRFLVDNTSGYCMEACSIAVDSLTNFALQEKFCYCNLVYGEALQSECTTKCPGEEGQSCGGKSAATVYAVQ